jgi:hypothetical protein
MMPSTVSLHILENIRSDYIIQCCGRLRGRASDRTDTMVPTLTLVTSNTPLCLSAYRLSILRFLDNLPVMDSELRHSVAPKPQLPCVFQAASIAHPEEFLLPGWKVNVHLPASPPLKSSDNADVVRPRGLVSFSCFLALFLFGLWHPFFFLRGCIDTERVAACTDVYWTNLLLRIRVIS